jgi:hypothetical protein
MGDQVDICELKKKKFIKLLFGITNCHVIDPGASSMPSSLPKTAHKRNIKKIYNNLSHR